ncbi:MAG: EamA family transporter, partial [Sulfurimonas sp.]
SFMGVGTLGPVVLFLISPYLNMPELDFMLGEFVMPQGVVWLYVLAMGILATISQLLMTKAYGYTKAGIVGTVSYSNIIFSICVGMLLGDAFPSMSTTIGISLIVIAGIMVARSK